MGDGPLPPPHSIGLSEEQMNELIRLKTREAIIFYGQINCPMKVKIEVDKESWLENQPVIKTPQLNVFNPPDYFIQHDYFRKKGYQYLKRFVSRAHVI